MIVTPIIKPNALHAHLRHAQNDLMSVIICECQLGLRPWDGQPQQALPGRSSIVHGTARVQGLSQAFAVVGAQTLRRPKPLSPVMRHLLSSHRRAMEQILHLHNRSLCAALLRCKTATDGAAIRIRDLECFKSRSRL